MNAVHAATPSKSARKREHLALQALGEKLVLLSVVELEKVPLDEPLLQAVQDARALRSRSALRRQRQLIGKLMRSADAAGIASALEALERRDRESTELFHRAEEWRERICAQGQSALAAFVDLTGTDARELTQLVREQQTAANALTERALRRRLFREIHERLQAVRESPSSD